jgi:hypothetical protein
MVVKQRPGALRLGREFLVDSAALGGDVIMNRRPRMKRLVPILLLAAAAAGAAFLFHLGCSASESNTDAGLDGGADGGGDAGLVAKREQQGKFIVLWIHGTPYEMGFQHGQLMREELKEGMKWINSDPTYSMLWDLAKTYGIVEIAEENSYQDIKEECKGLVDGANTPLWTYEKCLILNFGDVALKFIQDGMPDKQACSQSWVAGKADKDGKLYHTRILDWDKIKYILDYPTIIVRRPNDGVPHAYIGFPANLSPYTGINAEGVSIASNNAHPRDISQLSRTGRSHVQMVGQILKYAHNMEEARKIITDAKHMTTEILGIADGKNKQASVFELSAKCLGERKLGDDGVLWVTNHYLSPDAEGCDTRPVKEANLLRYERYRQWLEPGAKDWTGNVSTHYGQITPETLIKVMRDRINPYDGTATPADVFDNGKSIATYGALFAVLFEPESKMFWVAAGALPVPAQVFTGFSLMKLLNTPGAVDVTPADYPAEF